MENNPSSAARAALTQLNETHDGQLRSFVTSANDPNTDFPIQNLPFAVFRRKGSSEPWRVGTGIGDRVLDIAAVQDLLDGRAREAAKACGKPSMNALMDLGSSYWSALRLGLSRLLREDSKHSTAIDACLTPLHGVEFGLPAKIGSFSDYAASLHHVSKVTKVVRPENPELDMNMLWSPVAFHHRASSIRPDGHSFLRPKGQLGYLRDGVPAFGPSEKLDYEAELGIYIGRNTEFGQTLSVDEAEEAIFGMTVLNDWTARDIMFWERLPLGPFLSKSFDTTVSPWVVTMEALAPYRLSAERSSGQPDPLPNLDSVRNRQSGGLGVQVEVLLQTAKGEAAGHSPLALSLSNSRDMYWTVSQIVAHQASAGCNLEQGDLIGTGTISGPAKDESGCMYELTLGGRAPVEMPTGERRGFVEDGDTVLIRAFCELDGFRRIGFGCAASTVLANP